DDTVRVGSPDEATLGRTDLLRVSVLPDGGNNAGDTLIIDDRGDTTGRQLTVAGDTVGGGKGDTYFSRFAAVQFTGFDGGGIQVRCGAGNDQMIFDDTTDPAPIQWVLDSTKVTRTGLGSPISFSGLEQMVVRGGDGTNAYTVNQTGATVSTDIEDGSGN